MTDSNCAAQEGPYNIPEDFRSVLPLLKRCRQRNVSLNLKAHEVVSIVGAVAMRYNWFAQSPKTAILNVLAIVHWQYQKTRVKQICAHLVDWIETECKDYLINE
jgi:hypothetical protein